MHEPMKDNKTQRTQMVQYADQLAWKTQLC